MEEAEGAENTLGRISKNRDIIFEVGEHEKVQRRILASSAVLCETSTAFAALLGPYFREGQQLRNAENPVTIPLPEDGPDAMFDLLRLLHHVSVPELADNKCAETIFAWLREMEPDKNLRRLSAFAVAADKWCCVEALRLQSRAILLPQLHTLQNLLRHLDYHHSIICGDLAWLTTVAYLLNEEQTFAGFAKLLILHESISYLYLK